MDRRGVKYKLIDSGQDIARCYESKKKPKRSRILLNDWQNAILEQSFRVNPYPDRSEKYNLFMKTKIPMKNIKIWFQNRRAREKYSYEDMVSGWKQHKSVDYDDFEPRNTQFAEEFYKYYKN